MSRTLACLAAGLLFALPASVGATSEPAAVAAERLSHDLARTARHLHYRLERRAVFGGVAERRAVRAAAALEREARRLRRELAQNVHPIGFAGGHRLTRDARIAFDETAAVLSRVRTGHYLRGELAEARVLLRRLERLLGRPGRPLRPGHGMERPSESHRAPGWHHRDQLASSSLVPPVFHQ